MDENPKDQDVLFVKEEGQNELKVVSKEAIDRNGKLKTINPADGNNPDFLRIDKHGNVLENFFANFMRQVKDPTRFQFFSVPLEKVKEVAREISTFLNRKSRNQGDVLYRGLIIKSNKLLLLRSNLLLFQLSGLLYFLLLILKRMSADNILRYFIPEYCCFV
jgi:hypothetical protein